MENKSKSSVGSRAQDTSLTTLSFADKYVLLQSENQKLKDRVRRLHSSIECWRDRALFFQGGRDYYREQGE
jgi:hypothetical protein